MIKFEYVNLDTTDENVMKLLEELYYAYFDIINERLEIYDKLEEKTEINKEFMLLSDYITDEKVSALGQYGLSVREDTDRGLAVYLLYVLGEGTKENCFDTRTICAIPVCNFEDEDNANLKYVYMCIEHTVYMMAVMTIQHSIGLHMMVNKQMPS